MKLFHVNLKNNTWCEENNYTFVMITNDWFFTNYDRYSKVEAHRVSDYEKFMKRMNQFANHKNKIYPSSWKGDSEMSERNP